MTDPNRADLELHRKPLTEAELDRLDVFALEAMAVGWYDSGTFRSIIDGDDDRVFEDTDAVFLAAVSPQVVRRLIAAARRPAPRLDPDPLHVTVPEPAPRRLGCSVFALALLLLALAVGG